MTTAPHDGARIRCVSIPQPDRYDAIASVEDLGLDHPLDVDRTENLRGTD